MRVTLLRDSSAGQAGEKLSGPSVWRLCFPVKGCLASPADAEALAAVEADLATVTDGTRDGLRQTMLGRGVDLTPPPEPPKVVPPPARGGKLREAAKPAPAVSKPPLETAPPADSDPDAKPKEADQTKPDQTKEKE